MYDRPKVTFMVWYGTGKFQGEINDTRTEIKGSWLQSGKFAPVTLKRVDYETAPPPPEK
jgi:hypothetical protein